MGFSVFAVSLFLEKCLHFTGNRRVASVNINVITVASDLIVKRTAFDIIPLGKHVIAPDPSAFPDSHQIGCRGDVCPAEHIRRMFCQSITVI